MNKLLEENYKACGALIASARTSQNKSQQVMADFLGVSKRTVQNWENGSSSPDIAQVLAWFTVLELSPMPYFIRFMYPTDSLMQSSLTLLEIYNSLRSHLSVMTDADRLLLLYVLSGNHGSSPHAVISLVAEHCLLPVDYKIASATTIHQLYNMAVSSGTVSAELPIDSSTVDLAISRALDSVKKQEVI